MHEFKSMFLVPALENCAALGRRADDEYVDRIADGVIAGIRLYVVLCIYEGKIVRATSRVFEDVEEATNYAGSVPGGTVIKVVP